MSADSRTYLEGYFEGRRDAEAEAASPSPVPASPDEWVTLANDIRIVDGNHDLGAGALAEALTARGWTRSPVPASLVGAALRDLLEQTTEALIVARSQGVTTREPDPFAYDHRVMVYHGTEGHAEGADCAKCDYDRAFDSLIDVVRAALAASEPPTEDGPTFRDLLGDALHDEGLGCDVRPNQHGVKVDWHDHDGDAAHIIGRLNAANAPAPPVEPVDTGLREALNIIRKRGMANLPHRTTCAKFGFGLGGGSRKGYPCSCGRDTDQGIVDAALRLATGSEVTPTP